MAALTGTKNYTTAQKTKIKTAFSFLNGGSAATDAQLSAWIDRQIEAKVLEYYKSVEGAKADTAAKTSLASL